jgi:hypothetical protein
MHQGVGILYLLQDAILYFLQDAITVHEAGKEREFWPIRYTAIFEGDYRLLNVLIESHIHSIP